MVDVCSACVRMRYVQYAYMYFDEFVSIITVRLSLKL